MTENLISVMNTIGYLCKVKKYYYFYEKELINFII